MTNSITLVLIASFLLLIGQTSAFDVRNGMSRPWQLLESNKQTVDKTSDIKKFLKTLKNESPSDILKQMNKVGNTTEYKEEFFATKVDHFAYDNNATFKLRYLISTKYATRNGSQGRPSPILFYAGNEGPIEGFYDASGFITETLAKEFGALVIFAEHRFFGKSFPFGGEQDYDLSKNKYLTVEQAMADFVELLTYLKQEHSLHDMPVIAFGGSYGGMLSSWSRMKFPHIYAGAIASSAPILLFEHFKQNSNEFFKIVTETYRRYDSQCPTYIRQGFEALFQIRNNTQVASNPQILEELNTLFKPCSPIKNISDVTLLESTIEDAIVELAQYNYPYETAFLNPTPAEPVKVACERIEKFKNQTLVGFSPLLIGALGYTYNKFGHMDPLTKSHLTYLREASQVFFNYTGTQKCIDIGNNQTISPPPNGWSFMACTEMVMPMDKTGVDDMFNPYKWDLESFTKECQAAWKADVRPTWAYNYFGGRNFEKEINEYSNIVFINGKMDPWNAGCPKKSHNPRVTVFEADSAHHLDLRLPHPEDPESILHARHIIIMQIDQWINEY